MTYLRRLPFSRSYGVILPSSLTRILPFVLEFSSRLPVSVCGTGTSTTFSNFSRQCRFINFPTIFAPHQRNSLRQGYFTPCHYLALAVLFHSLRFDYLPVSLLHLSGLGGIRISTDCPSSTPFGLNLGPDLPWADEPSPGNLRLSTEEFLAPLSLLMPAFSLLYSPPPLSLRLLPVYIAPLPIYYSYIPKLRCQVLAPIIFGASSLDQ